MPPYREFGSRQIFVVQILMGAKSMENGIVLAQCLRYHSKDSQATQEYLKGKYVLPARRRLKSLGLTGNWWCMPTASELRLQRFKALSVTTCTKQLEAPWRPTRPQSWRPTRPQSWSNFVKLTHLRTNLMTMTCGSNFHLFGYESTMFHGTLCLFQRTKNS